MDSMIGMKFGRLTVIEYTGKNNNSRSKIYKCLCECGNYKDIARSKLRAKTKSCGCLKNENLDHRSGKDSSSFSGHGEISKTFWNRIHDSAIKRKKSLI